MFGLFKKKKDSKAYSLEDLASEVINISRKHYPKDEFEHDTKTNAVVSVSGDSPKTYLGNIFNSVRSMSPEQRKAYIEEFFESVMLSSGDLTFETLKSFLLVRVRTPYELSLRELILSPKLRDQGFFSVNIGDLFFDLTVDYGNTISTPTKQDLIKVGGGEEVVLNLALQNLKAVSDGSPWEKVSPHIWVSKYKDDYDAARIVSLYPNYKFPDSVENPIVFMPAHNVCLISDKDDPDTLELMIKTGDELAANTRKLSSALWCYENGGWHPVEVDKNHPSYSVVQNQWLMDESSFYNEQKEQLENIFLKENKDIFVATVSLAQQEGEDAIFSYSVLSFGVDTLLPKTDRVAFIDPRRPKKEQFLGMVTWDEFTEIIGVKKFVKYENLSPVRYNFTGQLGEDDFNKMEQHFR